MAKLKLSELFAPTCIFLLLMSISYAAWHIAQMAADEQAERRFKIEAEHLQEQIQNRFYTYEQVLRGGAGLFKVTQRVGRNDWYEYIEGLNLAEHFPGIQGVGFSEWIGDASKLAAHEEKIRAEGFSDYRVKPEGDRKNYTSIIYLEPFDERNRQAFGYDMFSETTRSVAMQRAINTGKPALSGKVELVQEITTDKQAGFLLYLPLYSTDQIPSTVAERQASFLGFVYSPFRAVDLISGILQEDSAAISFQIFDGRQLQENNLLYDGQKELEINFNGEAPRFSLVKRVYVSGRLWSIKFSSTPSFGTTETSIFSWVLLAAGVLFSFLAAIVAWMLISTKRNIQVRTVELSKQEALNTLLLEELGEAIISCDADFNLNIFNKTARTWFNADIGDIPLGEWTNFLDLFEEDGVTRLKPSRNPIVLAFKGKKVNNFPMCILVEGKPPRYALASGSPLIDSTGEKIGAVLLLRDITERKKNLENIKQQQQFLREVIDNSPSYIFARDRSGRYVLANKGYAKDFFKKSPESLIGKKHEDFVSPGDQEREEVRHEIVEQALREDLRVIESGESVSREKCVPDANGNQRWFYFMKLRINASNDKDQIALTVATEITEIKVSEERIKKLNEELEDRVAKRTKSLKEANDALFKAKEEAEGANQAKSSFLASMSHEIRTPMNGVVGMVDVLMTESLTKDQKDSIRTIRDSAFALLSIIDDLLDFSKIEAGHFELESVPISVIDVVESVVSSIVPVALKNNVHVTLFIDPATPENVIGDATRVRQIVTNLVGNAVKFSGQQTDREGSVHIRITVQQSEPLLLQFDIIDNGIGMSPDTAESVFESFVQAESSTTRRFGGTGLGLAICKRLVELMEGEIFVETEEGVGSTFTVVLGFDEAVVVEEKFYEDVAGVNCIVIPATNFHAEDFEVYLEDAGAIVCEAKDREEASQKALTLADPVIVLQENDHIGQDELDTIFTVDADIRHVMLSRGQGKRVVDVRHVMFDRGRRKRPRVESVNTVTIDSDGLRRAALLEAVSIAAGKASPEVMQSIIAKREPRKETPKALSVEAAHAVGKLILVAEDDNINTKVIKRQLSLLGFTAEFAENGLVALQMWRKKKYGLLLTDLHMPEMDGYTLTQTIRQEEPEGQRLPIVALTANALRGEVNRAKALGVDEYLTKPIELHLLKEALEQFFKPLDGIENPVFAGHIPDSDGSEHDKESGTQTNLSTEQNVSDNTSVFDPAVLPTLVGDDPEIIKDFLREYLDSLDELSRSIMDASKEEDWQTVAQVAHRLKSSSLSVGALQLGELCKELEVASKNNDKDILVNLLNGFTSSCEFTSSEVTVFIDTV